MDGAAEEFASLYASIDHDAFNDIGEDQRQNFNVECGVLELNIVGPSLRASIPHDAFDDIVEDPRQNFHTERKETKFELCSFDASQMTRSRTKRVLVADLEPRAKFKWAIKKVVWRQKNARRAVAGFQAPRFAAISSLRPIGLPTINPKGLSVDWLKIMALRNVYRFTDESLWAALGKDVNNYYCWKDLDLYISNPKTQVREKIITCVYLKESINQIIQNSEAQLVANTRRILFDLCSVFHARPSISTMGFWQFASGRRFSEPLFYEFAHKILPGIIDGIQSPDSQVSYASIGCMAALSFRSEKLRDEFIKHDVIAALVSCDCTKETCSSLVHALFTMSLCPGGAKQLAEKQGLAALVRHLTSSLDDEHLLTITRTICNCWPLSRKVLTLVLKESGGAAVDVLVRLLAKNKFSLENTPLLCALSQFCCRSEEFVKFETIQLFHHCGAQVLDFNDSVRKNGSTKGSHHLKYQTCVANVALQCVCHGLVKWLVFQTDDHIVIKQLPSVLQLLKNAAYIEENELFSIQCLIQVFEKAVSTGVPSLENEACQLILSRLRLSSNRKVSQCILTRMFESRNLETLNERSSLTVVLNMMRRFKDDPKMLGQAALAALQLALHPSHPLDTGFNAHLLLRLLQSTSGEAMNVLVCILYSVITTNNPVVMELVTSQKNFESVWKVLFKLPVNFNRPFGLLVLMVQWHLLSSLPVETEVLNHKEFCNILWGHLAGTCSFIREKSISDVSVNNADPLFNISFEKEIQMWNVISFKRSLLESNRGDPLRGSSSIIGFFDSQKEALSAYISFEHAAERSRKRYLHPTTCDTTVEGVEARANRASITALHVHTLIAMAAESLRRCKLVLDQKHMTILATVIQDQTKAEVKRLKSQSILEEGLELFEIPDSRIAFQNMEKLQLAVDKARVADLIDQQEQEKCPVYQLMYTKSVLADLFCVGLSRHHCDDSKNIAAWLIWELLYEPIYNQRMKPRRTIQDELVDDEQDESEEEIDDAVEEIRAKNSASVSDGWQQNVDLIFGRPRFYYEMRFATILILVAASPKVTLQQTAANLLARLSFLTTVSNPDLLVKVNAIPTLIRLIQSTDDNTAYHASVAIRTLLKSQVETLQLISAGGGFWIIFKLATAAKEHPPEEGSIRARMALAVMDILIVLRTHACNGTKIYTTEIKRGSMDLLHKGGIRTSFAPAVSSITISSTPRSKGMCKIQLEPLLFETDPKCSDQGPVFLFGQKSPSQNSPETDDRIKLMKFDKLGKNVLNDLPVFEDPLGNKFHLCVVAPPPQLKLELDPPQLLYSPVHLEQYAAYLDIFRLKNEEPSSFLLRFCDIAELKIDESYLMPSIRSKNHSQVARPMLSWPCHPQLMHQGVDMGDISVDKPTQVFVCTEEDSKWNLNQSIFSKDHTILWDSLFLCQRSLQEDIVSYPDLRSVFLDHASLIVGIYRFYAASLHSGDKLHKEGFSRMIEDCCIQVPANVVEEILASCEVNLFLSRSDFVDCLVLLSKRHFMGNVAMLDQAVSILLCDHLQRYLGAELHIDSNLFRIHRLFVEDVDHELKQFRNSLLVIFGKYSASRGHVSFSEWKQMFIDGNLMDCSVTEPALALSYHLSLRDSKMSFVRFLEGLCRLTDMAFIPNALHMSLLETDDYGVVLDMIRHYSHFFTQVDFFSKDRRSALELSRWNDGKHFYDLRGLGEKIRLFVPVFVDRLKQTSTRKKTPSSKKADKLRIQLEGDVENLQQQRSEIVQEMVFKLQESKISNHQLAHVSLAHRSFEKLIYSVGRVGLNEALVMEDIADAGLHLCQQVAKVKWNEIFST